MSNDVLKMLLETQVRLKQTETKEVSPISTSLLQPYVIGDILYASSTTALAKLADVAVGSYLRSGGVGVAPLWSTLKLPNAAATGSLLHASSTDTITALADVAVGSYLRSGGAGVVPLWSTLTLPNAATQGDILTATGANAVGVVADVATGNVLRSGGVGALPAYGKVALTTDVTNYVEGTWTPTYLGLSTAGVTTYTRQEGSYTRIGRTCFAFGRVTWTAATGTGVATISLPIAPSFTRVSRFPVVLWPDSVTFANGSLIGTIDSVSGTQVFILGSPATNAGTATGTIEAAGDVAFHVAYEV